MDRTRASDTEREWIVGLLREAATNGRITVEELDERCAVAYAAKTRGELAALVEDLPRPPKLGPAPAPPAYPPPAPRPQAFPPPIPPPLPPWIKPWPGLRPWLPGMQMFSQEWAGGADPREAGRKVLDHVVPIFTAEGYQLVHRTGAQIVLRDRLGNSVTIDMTLHPGRTETHVWGVASRAIRQALDRF
ncbi:DUF1707 domain-containing protein [Solirubrobacter phytolaccae]|uniref:DUF1707 domain-containing protein n=1 Tax=Solirubrobacter phytolaccae TaxID=1404360 RepID=A0A9X3NNQ6_9ACTN|nr:DUF1707 domain-containing protein [Solirubrobacter phytolaccae]MDA0184797.1 DUF1707 domain-containing protein [Solirubrobacter phytolaccae]